MQSFHDDDLRFLSRIHTADEAGPAEGPDYMFGWGLLNAQAAATLISGRSCRSSASAAACSRPSENRQNRIRASPPTVATSDAPPTSDGNP